MRCHFAKIQNRSFERFTTNAKIFSDFEAHSMYIVFTISLIICLFHFIQLFSFLRKKTKFKMHLPFLSYVKLRTPSILAVFGKKMNI